MRKTIMAPTTLTQAVKYFSDQDIALDFVVGLRWPAGVTCPHCAAAEPSFLKTRRIWKCRTCKRQFSVKVGTIFEDSPISLSKWLPALWMLANAKNGISSYELARALGVTQKTAWFMLHRVRLAMQTKTFGRIGGEVEVDETYVGGKARFMTESRKRRMMKGRHAGKAGKTAVMGLLSRDGRKGHSKVVRAEVSAETDIRYPQALAFVGGTVEPGATVYSDKHMAYRRLKATYVHQVIDHGVAYAKGKVHINGMENFWSLLKRGIRGTYVSVEPFHLFRYLDEQIFRFNTRKTKDVARFVDVVRQIVGKRLTYDKLIGADLAPATT
jgi:transposase-like protein